jgi:predicted MFS family arabinose efflux permease
VSYYFRGKNLGMMNSLIFVCMLLGQMTGTMLSATVFSPLLGGWRNVFFAYSIPAIIVGLLWLTTRPAPVQDITLKADERALNFRQIFGRVVRIKYLWLLGLACMAHIGSYLSISSYIPLYLKGIGWPGPQADGVLTLMLGASSIGTIPIVFLSDRLKNRRMFLFWIFIVVSLAISALMITRNPAVMTLVIVFNGMLRGSANPIINTLATEVPGMKPEYMGTAVGLISTIGLAAAFIMPPVGNGFAAVDPAMPFIFWAGLTVIMACALLFVKTRAASA